MRRAHTPPTCPTDQPEQLLATHTDFRRHVSVSARCALRAASFPCRRLLLPTGNVVRRFHAPVANTQANQYQVPAHEIDPWVLKPSTYTQRKTKKEKHTINMYGTLLGRKRVRCFRGVSAFEALRFRRSREFSSRGCGTLLKLWKTRLVVFHSFNGFQQPVSFGRGSAIVVCGGTAFRFLDRLRTGRLVGGVWRFAGKSGGMDSDWKHGSERKWPHKKLTCSSGKVPGSIAGPDADFGLRLNYVSWPGNAGFG